VRIGAVAVAIGAGWLLFVRASGPGEIPAAVAERATTAGCDAVERPVLDDPSRDHLEPGEEHTYEDQPPAAGPHDPSPMPDDPHVYRAPIPQTRAVHNLEHAFVLIWYRPTADAGLADDAVDDLEALARAEDRVIMAPYPDLPDGGGLALVAWNTRWRCPASIDAETAVAIADAFVDAYRGTTNAPEAPRGLLGPLLSAG
jgi:Protein of unknown function (DUF3105)